MNKKIISFLVVFILMINIGFSAIVTQTQLDDYFKLSNTGTLSELCEDLCEEQTDIESCKAVCNLRNDNCFEMQENTIVLEKGYHTIKTVHLNLPICVMTADAKSQGLDPELATSYGELKVFDVLVNSWGLNEAQDYQEEMKSNRLDTEAESQFHAEVTSVKNIIWIGIDILLLIGYMIMGILIGKDYLVEIRNPTNEHKDKGMILREIIADYVMIILIIVGFTVAFNIVMSMI